VLESALKVWQELDMNSNELKTLLKPSRFGPITICTTGNKTYSISHPEFAALSPAGDTLIIFLAKGGHDVVDVPHIERVQVRRRNSTRS